MASTQRLRPSLRCFTVITICYSIPSLPSHHFHAIHLYNKILLHIALAKHRNYFLLLHNDVFMSCRHNTKCSYSFYFLICLRLIAVCQGWKESGWCLLCSKCMHRTGDPTRWSGHFPSSENCTQTSAPTRWEHGKTTTRWWFNAFYLVIVLSDTRVLYLIVFLSLSNNTIKINAIFLYELQTEYKYCYDLVLHYVLHYLNKDLKEKKWESELHDGLW